MLSVGVVQTVADWYDSIVLFCAGAVLRLPLIQRSQYLCWCHDDATSADKMLMQTGKAAMFLSYHIRADSRFAPSQWEKALLCNDVSHWLGTNLESALYMVCNMQGIFDF